MNKKNTLLKGLLIIISIISFGNVVTFPLFPSIFPFSSFSILSHAIMGPWYNMSWMVVFSFLACIIMFLSAISVNKNHFVCPMLTTLYFIYDIIILCHMLITAGMWINYLIGLLQDVVLITLLCVYFYRLIILHQANRVTEDGSMC